MFSAFFQSRQRKVERYHLSELISYCRKRLRQDHDLLSEKQEMGFRGEIQKAQNLLTAEGGSLSEASDSLTHACHRIFPPAKSASLRENGEVILVALIVAMAVRAFFLQPFKIPTGSMQPTLNGITVRASQPPERQWWYRLVSLPLFGERVIHFVAQRAGELHSVHPIKLGPLHYGGSRGFLNFLPMDAVEFYIGPDRYTVPVDERKFREEILWSRDPSVPTLLKPHYAYTRGKTILDCVVKTGDQLFVDRFTYHFRKPKRGEVFVFETHDIPVHAPGDFYIKRLAGVPGDVLLIKERKLYINGKLAQEPGFQKVMSQKNGYQGYGSSQDQRLLASSGGAFTLKEKEYFALGDNSFNSADSRFWGVVPYHDIVGRGFFVYWPFKPHFGRVE